MSPVYTPLFRRVEHVLLGRARMVISVSEQGVTDYVQAIGPHPSMTVVPNGVDLARFAFTAAWNARGARRRWCRSAGTRQ